MRLIAFLILIVLSLTGCQNQHQIFQQRILSFGTLIDLSIAIHPSQQHLAEQATQQIEDLLKLRHQQWHAWLPGELANLNKALQLHSSSIASNDLIQLILDSKKAYQQSNKLFNPAMGKLIAAWGFHDPNQKDLSILNELQQHIPNMDNITVHDKTVSTNNRNVQLDFGGIAKGLAIKQIRKILLSFKLNNYLINIGGDLFSQGTKFNKPWKVGIQDPFKTRAIGSIALKNPVSLFTSGNYQRYYYNNNIREHHIINPLTGKPSTSISSATVLHPDPTIADAAATTLMIAPQKQWHQIAQQMHIEDYLIITENKDIWVSNRLFKKTTFNTSYKIHIISSDL